MIDFDAALQKVMGLIKAKEQERTELERRHQQEVAAIDKELEALERDRGILENARQAAAVAQRYGVQPRPIAPTEPAPKIIKDRVAVLPALIAFLHKSMQAGVEFPHRTALAKAAIKDASIRKVITVPSTLVKRMDELLDEVHEQAVNYLPLNTVPSLQAYLKQMQDNFPSRRTKAIPAELPPYYAGDKDPLKRVPWGGKVAALAFTALVPMKNGQQPNHDQRPANKADLVKQMSLINDATGNFVGRIDLDRCLTALDVALKAAVSGDNSKLGEHRVRMIIRWGYDSVEAFYNGYFVRLLAGETISPPKCNRPEIRPEDHFAIPSLD